MAARPAWMDAPTREDGTPLDPRWHTLVVLPTDYDDFGGDVVRWDDPQESDPDCSCGCVHFRERDLDWGVCKRTDAPRNHNVFTERAMRRGDRLPDAVWERHAPPRVMDGLSVDPATGRVTFGKDGQ